ncbi:MAG: translocation/assembly module TamB domain-containing protein [Alistipes sp.]|nr:translocation/assembly module TamB domain-containing protein [Alistipes sp.]
MVKLISAAILLLLVLPLSVSLLLDIPAVQNYIVHKAASVASEHLETRVSIDRVNIGLLNKIRVYGIYVEDYQRDTLLYAKELRALVTGVGMFGEGLVFSSASLDGVKLFITESPDSVMNIKQIVDRLSRRKGKGNFRLSIHRADISDMELRIERLEHRNPEYGVDYGNMRLSGLSGRVSGLAIAGSKITGHAEGLSFRERSGFELNSMDGDFEVDRGFVGLGDTRLRTDESDIMLRSLTLTGGEWSRYKDFISNVTIDATAEKSVVSSNDVGYFAPSIRRWRSTVSDLSLSMNGTVSDFRGSVGGARINGRSELVGDISAKGLPDVGRSRFSLDLSRLHTDSREIAELARNIAGVEIPSTAGEILHRAGGVTLAGSFNGSLRSFRSRGRLDTEAGSLRFDAAMRPDEEAVHAIEARVASRRLDLGRLLAQKMLGDAGFSVEGDGTFGGGSYDMNISGDISRFTVGGYGCDSIGVSGRAADGDIRALMTVRDKALDLDMNAILGLQRESEPSYDMVMTLRHADLSAMGINRRDSVSMLSAEVGLSAEGRIPDELNGMLSLADARYVYDTGEVESEYMSVTLESNEDTRSVKLSSDFADAVFESRNNYKDVLAYVKAIVASYLPLLYGDGSSSVSAHDSEESDEHLHSVSLLSVLVKDFNPIADAVSRGLQIADGSQINVLLDPVCDRFMMRAHSDYIERERLLATSLRMDASNEGDSLAVRMTAGDLYVGTLHIPELTLHGAARDNTISLNGDFVDTVRTFSGMVDVSARLRRDSVTRRRGVDIDFRPSYIASRDNRWDITAGMITADSSRVEIDRFAVRNSRQELLVNGVASRSREDSLMLTLRDFDLSPFTQVVDRLGYSLEGRTNGYAKVKSALQGSSIVANIRLDSLAVNTLPVKALEFDSRWDFERNRARFTLSTVAERDTVIRGFYVPSEVRYLARLKADSLDMALLDPMLKGVVSETAGTAAADLTLTGERRAAELHGDITVRDLSTKVDFTQVTYSVPEAHIAVRDNLFRVEPVTVYDTEGRSGRMWFDLSLNHLSNISYTLNVVPERMLVLNTTSRDNDYFYGKVYASGAATIEGDKSGVNMDIVASTEDNSEFFMPLSSKSNVSNADFVIFESADKPDTTDFLVRKKMMFERRQRQRTSSAGRMDINMALDVRPNAQFQLVIDPTVGDIIKGRGEGALNIHVNPKANIFEMYGDYTISEGSYLFTLQNIINKKFIIEEGSTIQWTGEPVDALLNIDAVYKLKASLQPLLAGSVSSSNVPTRAVPVECIIHLNDRLTNPTVTFDVEVPNADPDVQSLVANALSTPESRSQQFLYLLVANSFISEASADTSATLGVTASAATGFELLSNQLSNWLSADTYNIVIRYRPKTEMTSDEVDIGFSTELVNNRLLLEVEGNYLVDRSMAANQNSNLMGEAYLTWLIDRAGNLRLKGFTHTIDRFDENQGLQETGIGIYYKESFNNLKDLKQRVRDRFTLRNRRIRKEERRNAGTSSESESGEVDEKIVN